MTGQFGGLFKLYRLNLLIFICICIYGVIYTGNIYGINYSRNNTNQVEENPGLLIISFLVFSNPHLYKRTGN